MASNKLGNRRKTLRGKRQTRDAWRWLFGLPNSAKGDTIMEMRRGKSDRWVTIGVDMAVGKDVTAVAIYRPKAKTTTPVDLNSFFKDDAFKKLMECEPPFKRDDTT